MSRPLKFISGHTNSIKGLLLFLLQAALFRFVHCQVPVGTWSDHLNYSTAGSVAVSPAKVYASTGASLIVYDREYEELKKLSKVNGLTGTGISTIAWSDEEKILLVAYKNTDLDLILSDAVYNLPDIRNKMLPVEKRINRIRMSGKFAFLSTSFGIVVVDLSRKEINDTWHPGPDSDNNEVFDTAIGNGSIYAATSEGLWVASISDPGLAFYGSWERVESLPDPLLKCNHLIFSGSTLYINVPEPDQGSDRVYALSARSSLSSFSEGLINTSFDPSPAGFTISSPEMVRYFSTEGILRKTVSSYGWGIPAISQGIAEGGDIWLADTNYGLIRGTGMTQFTRLTLPGPGSNFAGNLNSSDGRTIICAGGTDETWAGFGRPFRVSVYGDDRFDEIVEENLSDAIRSCFDPDDNSHFFISSWGGGLFECRNNSVIRHYDDTNSPLQAVTGANPGVKICGMATDRSKNLWMTLSGVPGSIRILKPDGSWISYPLNINAPVIGDIVQSKNGLKWIILPNGYGLFIIDDNNTPEISTDDRHKKFVIKDPDGNIIANAFSIAEDLDGNIWVGTDHGPVVYYSNSVSLDDDIRCFRIKIPRNDGSGLADYMLGTETITSVCVDGANRKWLGTLSSGAYLLSADGTKMLKNFNITNSPLFSNRITSVTVDNLSGEVWFGTSEGTLSLRETATAGGREFGRVYSFPNPVRETFTGNVTITGLMRDTDIKITDISGNLVFESVSEGGQATWDLSTYTGKRVATGVYLVFCSSSDGSQSCVTKILVIGR